MFIFLKMLLLLFIFLCKISNISSQTLETFIGEIERSSSSVIFFYYSGENHFTNWTLYKNINETRTDVKITFDCAPTDYYDYSLACTLKSNIPINRLWSNSDSKSCSVSYDGLKSGCGQNICNSKFYIFPTFNRRPPTSGGEVIITGTFLRLCADDPQYLMIFGYYKQRKIPIKGNIEDPNFDCDNITAVFPPGYGEQNIGIRSHDYFPVKYQAPYVDISKLYYDSSKSILTLNGDNFYTDNQVVVLKFDGQISNNFNITIPHKQIVVNNFNREYGGKMKIEIEVGSVPMDIPHQYCFPAKPTSVSSVSNLVGGIVTLKGTYFPNPNSTSSDVTINIGNLKCEYIRSNSTELECLLPPPNNGNTNDLLTISINGCNGSEPLLFKYDIPSLNGTYYFQTYNSRIITLNGISLGSINKTFVQVYGLVDLLQAIDVTLDQTKLSFILPVLKCGNNIKIIVINNGIPSNEISINSNLIALPYIEPFVNNGTGLSLYLYNIHCPVSTSIVPISQFINNETECTIPTIVVTPTGDEYYSTSCSVVPGTGNQHPITIKYNSQQYYTTFSYGSPKVLNQTVIDGVNDNSSIVVVDGVNFNSEISLFNSSFSNRTITPIDTSFKDNQFKFTLLETDENDFINIEVDGVSIEPRTMIYLLPKEISFNHTQKFKTHNGILKINGKNLLSTQSNNENYHIKVTANNKECKLITNSISNSNLLVSVADGVGTFNLSLYVGNNLYKSAIFDYHDAEIVSATGEYNGSILKITINGNNFGDGALLNIDQFPDLQNIPCNELVFHDDGVNRELDQLICEFETNRINLPSSNASFTIKLGNIQTDPFNIILTDYSKNNTNYSKAKSLRNNGLSVSQKAVISVLTIIGFILIVVIIILIVKNSNQIKKL